jgi:hypothetical protein
MPQSGQWFDMWGAFNEEGAPAVVSTAEDLLDLDLRDTEKICLIFLRFLAAHGKILDYSTEKLALDIKTTPQTARKVLASLREKGRLDPLCDVPWLFGRRGSAFVYFFQAETGGPIKIGLSGNPNNRLASVQTGHPTKLRMLSVVEGGSKTERELHSRFAHLRLEGEWFAPAEELIEFIRRSR